MMKKCFALVLSLLLCAMLVLPACAENQVAKVSKLMEGTWKETWRYIPSVAKTKESDQNKIVNLFTWPEKLAKSGMTVVPYLTGDDTGAVYLTFLTSGDSHNIANFDGGYTGKVALSEDGNALLLMGLDGSVIFYLRQE